jgi:L-lactate dehydrogenase (cytochrome)/(S)-mandelate dehydrogenase
MRYDQAINLDDLRKIAKRRLPKIAYDFIEGGVEDEHGLGVNERAFRNRRLLPRYMVDVSQRDQSVTLFGRRYASPFGIAPTGLIGLFRPGGDLMLAEAAAKANVPFIMSGAATATIEDLGKIAPQHGWYQLYTAKDRAISEDQIRRAADAGLSTLVITVDVPVRPRRERNLRNGFRRPLKLSLGTYLDALRYPSWLAGYLTHGMPMIANWAHYAPKGASADTVADLFETQTTASITWKDIERFRALWPRNLVLKGIMRVDDATRAAEAGCDGLMVSNHGARQVDQAPSPLEVLPEIRDAVGDRLTLMLDSGVRRGADALIALCLGAKAVFTGRMTLYGTVAGGRAGAEMALGILRREVDLVMGQIGAPNLGVLGPDFLWKDDPRRN